jgi:hypothetical protein
MAGGEHKNTLYGEIEEVVIVDPDQQTGVVRQRIPFFQFSQYFVIPPSKKNTTKEQPPQLEIRHLPHVAKAMQYQTNVVGPTRLQQEENKDRIRIYTDDIAGPYQAMDEYYKQEQPLPKALVRAKKNNNNDDDTTTTTPPRPTTTSTTTTTCWVHAYCKYSRPRGPTTTTTTTSSPILRLDNNKVVVGLNFLSQDELQQLITDLQDPTQSWTAFTRSLRVE